jgi:ubiquinone/menaquinone biosynthesis C-methylase UbiE
MAEHPAGATFDSLASRYDELWTRSPVGRLQRDAVWRRVDRLFAAGACVLDIGCGTGEDAAHLMSLGVTVRAIDASAEMVRVARARGVDAMQVPIEELSCVEGRFDAAISDFGALNCIADLDSFRRELARLVRPGGAVALCTLGRFCLWETIWFLLRGDRRRALRRWGGAAASSLGITVRHFSMSELEQAMKPEFRLLDWRGIGVFVPPSYITCLSAAALRAAGALDYRLAHWRLFRALGDHRLAIFVRNETFISNPARPDPQVSQRAIPGRHPSSSAGSRVF